MSNSSLMPVPDAEISAWISSLRNILSMRDRSTLRILPRIGRIAWKRGSRAFLALPPALSPSTMNSSASSALRVEQSASLPGIDADSSSDLRRVRSRAWRAAMRACAACVDLVTMTLRLVRVLFEPLGELLVRGLLDERADLGVAELGLRLALELRVAQLHRDDRGEALADVLAEEVLVLLLEDGPWRARSCSRRW